MTADERKPSWVGPIGDLAERAVRAELMRSTPERQVDCFDLKVSLIHVPTSVEGLTTDAAILHQGRRTALGRCSVRTPQGELVAVVSATYRVQGETR